MRTLRSLAFAGAAAAGALVCTTASAQLAPRPPLVATPGKSLAGTDDTDSIALNPAQLAFMPSWELRYIHVQTPSDTTSLQPGRGDAFGLGFPLLFGLATGMRLDFVRPPEAAPMGSASAFTWDLAWKIADSLAIAFDVRRWYASDIPALDTATSIDFGLSLRPCRYLGLAFVARDMNAPTGLIAGDPNARITRTFDVGLAFRPTGTRALEIGLESRFWGRSSDLPGAPWWSPRMTLGFDIPRVGRFVSSFQAMSPTTIDGFESGSGLKNSWVATAGVEVGFPWMFPNRVGGGAIFGNGLRNGSGGSPGWYVDAAVQGYDEPGVPAPGERAVEIRVEDTPGARGHVHMLRRLAKLGRDPQVRAIVLVAKSELAGSTAHAEELGDAIAALQAKGIKVICHLEDAGGRSLLACASADRIFLHPAGGIRFAGLRSENMYFGEALRNLGVEPEFVRVKEHKTAPEEIVRDGPTPTAAADQREYLYAVEQVYLDRLALGRHLTKTQVKLAIDKGPFIADEAIAAGFADGKVFDDELPKKVREVVGSYVRLEEDSAPIEAPKSFGTQPRIALIYIDGDIIDGRSQTIPILGEKMAGGYTIADAIDQARKDPNIAGVVLRIESPGGSSLASDVMWRAAELLYDSGKPVVVSMGSVAASGGYYAAAFGAPIYADRATVTGSIGIFYGKADISGLLAKLGVHVVTQKTAPKADAESLFRPFTDDERKELLVKVSQFYSVFLDRVSRGRKMTIEQVDAVGRGKVWLGDAALKNHLVDHIGGIDMAIADIKQKAGLDVDAPIVEMPTEKNGLLDLVLDLMGAKVDAPSAAQLPKLLGRYMRAVVPFIVFRSDESLALWEGMDEP